MAWTNYHSHSHFCDGRGTPEEMVEAAISAGVTSLGFSSHAPLPFSTSWAMPGIQLPQYLNICKTLRERYRGKIELYSSLEIDYIPGLTGPESKPFNNLGLDYSLGSIHFVNQFPDGRHWQIDGTREEFEAGIDQIFGGNVQKAVSRYFELIRWMVLLETPDIVGHLDKIKLHNQGNQFFRENETWYREEIEKTLRVISNMKCIIEVNTRGLYQGKSLDLYPSQWILERILKYDIPITLSSDAHEGKEIAAGFEIAARILRKIGFTHVLVLHKGKWVEAPFGETGVFWPGNEMIHPEISVA